MNYIKQNHLSILIILFLVGSSLLGNAQIFGALDRTTVGNPWTFSGNVTMSGTNTLSGATTLSNTLSTTGIYTENAGLIRSYSNATSTVATSYTVEQADILNYDTMLLTLNKADSTFTLPATSTLTAMVPTAGDRQDFCIYNATTTAGIDLTIAAGTGIDLEVASSTNTGAVSAPVLTILGGSTGCFSFIRKTNTDILGLFTRFVDGD